MVVIMLSCPATYCNVNGSVYSPASVRNMDRSACRTASAWVLIFLRSCAILLFEHPEPEPSTSLRFEIIRGPAGTPLNQRSQSEEQQFAKKQILKMVFKKVQEGRKIRPTYGIFGYTRRDKLFIFVGVGVFHPLSRRIVSTTHALLRKNSCQCPKPKRRVRKNSCSISAERPASNPPRMSI